MNDPTDLRQYAPATQRNREPILAVLQRVLPPQGTILETASGTGEHAVFFAPRLAPRFWQPSEPNPWLRDSIEAWRSHLPAPNLGPAIDLDVCQPTWPVETGQVDLIEPIWAIVSINMIHISPWESCLGLLAGAGRMLPAGGILYLYGPFKQGGEHTDPSNAQFDAMLRADHPAWGVRDLGDVVAAAEAQGLQFQEQVTMPANNLSVILRR